MKYHDSNYKIRTIWRGLTKTKIALERKKEENKNYKSEIISIPPNNLIKKIQSLDSTEWEELTRSGSSHFKYWDVTLTNFPLRLLPQIRVGVVFEDPEVVSTIEVREFHVICLIDEPLPDDIQQEVKNVRLRIFLRLRVSENVQLRAKYLIRLMNPQIYIEG